MSLSVSHATLVILVPYLVAVVFIGYVVRRNTKDSRSFLHARHSMPASVTSIALLAANCGALEIIGITSASAKYGLAALHFYWIGAVPAMVFLALFMMPIYTKSQALTVPDFLRARYNDATHLFSSCCLAARMALVAGISLYAISAVLHVFLGWTFSRVSVLACSVVLCYTALGGLRATIYTEILQLVLTIAGVLPLTYKILHDFDGIAGIRNRLPHEMAHIWTTLTWMNPTGAKLDRTGVIVGLGAVLSFGYWCTDFLIIQRALTARNLQNAIKTPLIAAVFKMCFPILLVVPGTAAAILIVKPSGTMQFDQALPAMMNHYYGAGLLALGLCAILASLMSGLAGNISALSVVWTQDLYRAHIQRTATDKHYLLMGRAATVVACGLSMATAYIALHFSNLMDYQTLVFSLFDAPLFASFLLGMFTTWATPAAGLWGLILGVFTATGHNFAVRTGAIHYGSDLLASFYGAIYGFTAGLTVNVFVSLFTKRKSIDALFGLTYFTRPAREKIATSSLVLAGLVLIACIALNFIFR